MKNLYSYVIIICCILVFSCKKETPNNTPKILDQTFSVQENSTPGLVCATIIATDEDGDQLTFEMKEESAEFPFEINPNNGNIIIKTAAKLDYELTQQYKFQVTVTDGSQIASALITINITDIAEAPNLSDQSFSLNENVEGILSIGILKFGSKGLDEAFSFNIVEGNTSGLFFIGEKSGELFLSKDQKLDFETINKYTLIVKVQNISNSELYTYITVVINVIDVNEKPTINDQSFSILENSQNNTEIGSIKANDVDAGQSLNYSIIETSVKGAVNIDGETGKLYVLDKSKFDYETQHEVLLKIKVMDNGTVPLADTAKVIINILDVDENPVITTKKLQIDENSAIGSEVGKVMANSYSGAPIEYSILAGDGMGKFLIEKNTGKISVAQSGVLNYEVKNNYSLTIKVNEIANPQLTTNAIISINLNDVNENPIFVDQQITTNSSKNVGAILYKIQASDPDFGQSLSYSILSGNSEEFFSIDSSSGNLILEKPFTMNEANEIYFVLSVRVRDNGVNQLYADATITVNVVQMHIPTNGMIAYYPFNNNAIDESTNSYDGNVVGPTITSDRNSNANSAYSFDGNNDYIDLGPKVGDGIRSISLWFKLNIDINGNNTRAMALLARDGDYDNNHEFNLAFIPLGWEYPTGTLRFMYSINKNNYYYSLSDSQNWEKDKWYHVVVTIDENEGILMYINSSLQHSIGKYYSPTEYSPLRTYIGSWGVTPNWYFPGKIDDLILYNRTLSLSEVETLYEY